MEEQQKQFLITIIVVSVVVSSIFGFLAGGFVANQIKTSGTSKNDLTIDGNLVAQEQAVVQTVEKVSPAVVSIIATKDLPVIEQYFRDVNPFEEFFNNPLDFFSPFQFRVPEYRQRGTEEREVGGGTGFIISEDGMIVTNKHVVDIEGAAYTVLTNEGKRYSAEVLGRDPVQDIAILKIDERNLPVAKLGNSDNIQIGQSVIAIGNALGEFRNTVSVGVISGLSRSIAATGPGGVESLEGLIQTDAAINQGNSGGPLLNLSGEVIGINVAMASGAQSIGFALPVNLAKRDIEQVKNTGKISSPFIGIRYAIITSSIQEQNNLPVDYGALIVKGQNQDEPAIVSGSPADRAGLQEGDIILEIEGKKIDKDNTLAKILQDYNVGDKISLKVLSGGQEKNIQLTLAER